MCSKNVILRNSLILMRNLFCATVFFATLWQQTASTLWNGSSKVKGGYITVKKNGDVIANYAMESDAFKNYLYQHCYMDYPSTNAGHGDYGKVYVKDRQYFFNLNFQVRIY